MRSVLEQIGKSIYEATAGRIFWHGNMWALVGGVWDKNRLVNKNLAGNRHSFINKKGEFVEKGRVLVKRLCTSNCPCPPSAGFYSDGKRSWVPATVCRKCLHHRAAGREFPFPRCTFGRQKTKKDVAFHTLTGMNRIIGDAVDKANDILK